MSPNLFFRTHGKQKPDANVACLPPPPSLSPRSPSSSDAYSSDHCVWFESDIRAVVQMPNLYKLFKYISFLFGFLWREIKRPICGECSGIRRCLGKAHSPRCLHSHRINMSSGPN